MQTWMTMMSQRYGWSAYICSTMFWLKAESHRGQLAGAILAFFWVE
jgi:hypothetical protein